MMQIKKKIKKNKILKKIIEFIFFRPIKNINNDSFQKRALLSYSIYPFKNKKGYLKHPNYMESFFLNNELKRKGYKVDVYNNTYTKKIDYKQYDLIIGEGVPISNYFKSKEKKINTIYYGTGSHPLFNNEQSLKRIFSFFKKYNIFLENSSRIVDLKWSISASLSDSFILIGNEQTKKTFLKYNEDLTNKYLIKPPCYLVNRIENFSRKNKKKFLWFGSYGLIHKGLDIVIETFMKREDLELYICGYLDNEQDFFSAYPNIENYKNIHFEGFIDLSSDRFRKLMEEVSFVILLSCSEGTATSVITVMGNGGLIPIISKECGITEKNAYIVKNIDVESLLREIENVLKLESFDIVRKSQKLMEEVEKNYSIESFEKNLRKIFDNLL